MITMRGQAPEQHNILYHSYDLSSDEARVAVSMRFQFVLDDLVMTGASDMLSKNLTAELRGKIGAPIRMIASFGRTLLNKTIRLGVCAVSSGGVSGALLTLAVLTILTRQPNPTPVPSPS